jgi:hypothetical protein
METRYCKFKTMTGITLVIGLIFIFSSILSKESSKLEDIVVSSLKKIKKIKK